MARVIRFNVVFLLALLGFTVLSGNTPDAVSAAATAANKKVRIVNKTDDTGIRIRCVHFKHDLQFTRDVQKGQLQLVQGVDPGDRGIIIYEDLNETVIATGHFTLEASGKNVEVTVFGDKTAGYKLSYKLFD